MKDYFCRLFKNQLIENNPLVIKLYYSEKFVRLIKELDDPDYTVKQVFYLVPNVSDSIEK